MGLQTLIQKYLNYCELQKGLNLKTIKAYRIDLEQFYTFSQNQKEDSEKEVICNFIESLHANYKPKSIKRKIATLKAFYEYLNCEEVINDNPFNRIHLKIKEPIILPKVIPEKILTKILNEAYLHLSIRFHNRISNASRSNYRQSKYRPNYLLKQNAQRNLR